MRRRDSLRRRPGARGLTLAWVVRIPTIPRMRLTATAMLLLLAAVPALGQDLVLRFACLDCTPAVLDRLGRDRGTGELPTQVPLDAALSLLDPDQVTLVAFARVRTAPNHEGADDRTHRAIYLEPTPEGRLEQHISELVEGMAVRVTPMVDREGRIRIDGQLTLSSIDQRAPLVGFDRLPLGRPLTHATQTINPAAVLHLNQGCIIAAPGGAAGRERVILIGVEAAQP